MKNALEILFSYLKKGQAVTYKRKILDVSFELQETEWDPNIKLKLSRIVAVFILLIVVF